jgi:hypothetical protein
MTIAVGGVAERGAGWRFKLGIAIFALIPLALLLIPLAVALDVPAATVAALTGVIVIGNKILLLLVIAVMGKPGFQQLKRTLAGHLGVLAPAAAVGPLRHRVGLVMFCLPLITAALEPYVDNMWPGLRPNKWQFQLLGDLMLIASFFVLGGDFWGKVRALFIRTARVVDAEDAIGTSAQQS